MKFSAWVKLILQVNLELFLSGCSIFYAFIRLLFPKRPKNVRGKTIVVRKKIITKFTFKK